MCIFNRSVCDVNCEFYNTYSKYTVCRSNFLQNNFSVVACDKILIKLTNTINDNLMQGANGNLIKQAYLLIKHGISHKVVDILGYNLYLDLCKNAVLASIAIGMPDINMVNWLMFFFQNVLEFEQNKMKDYEYMNYYNLYNLLFFQVLHLQTKNYQEVLDKFRLLKISDSVDHNLWDRLVAQTTASQYLLGKTKKDTISMIKSRDTIYRIYKDLDTNSLTSLHYFVIAKLIEHHTETQKYVEVEEAVKTTDKYRGMSLNAKPSSLEEAINKVIFHRDVYRALKMMGDQGCAQHLQIAEELAIEYNITDQINKIKSIKSEWEKTILPNNREIEFLIKKESNNSFDNHKCDISEPFFFISYSHKDSDIVKLDIARFYYKYNYWIDFENLDGGRCSNQKDWTDKVLCVLSNKMCKGVVVYCSPNSIRQSIGTLREAEWLEQNRSKELYVFLCGFTEPFTPKEAAKYLEEIDFENTTLCLRIKKSFEYIMQATQSLEKYSYYFWDKSGSHLNNSDFVNWLTKINS